MAQTLQSLVVEVKGQNQHLLRSLKQSDQRIDRLSGNVTRLGGALLTAFAGRALIAGMARLSGELFKLGSDAAETRNKLTAVFGDSIGKIDEFNRSFAGMAGLSEEAGESIIATTGAIVQGMGFAEAASADLAVQVLRVAGDLASFNNLPTAETARAITAAFANQRERLDSMGIVIRQVELDQRALIVSGKQLVSELTAQDRVTATLQLVTERAGAAIGDLERTADSTANVVRQLAGAWTTLKTEIGKFLAESPLINAMLIRTRDLVRDMIQIVNGNADQIRATFVALGEIAGAAFTIGITQTLDKLDFFGGNGFLTRKNEELLETIRQNFAAIGDIANAAGSLQGRSGSLFGQRIGPNLLAGRESGGAAGSDTASVVALTSAAFRRLVADADAATAAVGSFFLKGNEIFEGTTGNKKLAGEGGLKEGLADALRKLNDAESEFVKAGNGIGEALVRGIFGGLDGLRNVLNQIAQNFIVEEAGGFLSGVFSPTTSKSFASDRPALMPSGSSLPPVNMTVVVGSFDQFAKQNAATFAGAVLEAARIEPAVRRGLGGR